MRIALLCLLLAGCATTQAPPIISPAPAAQVVVKTVCLPLKAYAPDQELALGRALAALTADNPLVQAMADYGAMRAADRAACADR